MGTVSNPFYAYVTRSVGLATALRVWLARVLWLNLQELCANLARLTHSATPVVSLTNAGSHCLFMSHDSLLHCDWLIAGGGPR